MVEACKQSSKMLEIIDEAIKEVESAGEIEGLSKAEILEDYFAEVVEGHNVKAVRVNGENFKVGFNDKIDLRSKLAAKLNIFLKEQIVRDENYIVVSKNKSGDIQHFSIHIPKASLQNASLIGKVKKKFFEKEKYVSVRADKDSIEIPFLLISDSGMREIVSEVIDMLGYLS